MTLISDAPQKMRAKLVDDLARRPHSWTLCEGRGVGPLAVHPGGLMVSCLGISYGGWLASGG